MSALAPFHDALYERLSTNAGLLAYAHASMAAETPPRTGVATYDYVPKPPAETAPKFPYIALESYNESRVGIFAGEGFDDTAQVGVWDNYRGKIRVLQVLKLIGLALATPLSISGYGSVRAKMDLVTMAPDSSGLKHGIYRVRAVVLG